MSNYFTTETLTDPNVNLTEVGQEYQLTISENIFNVNDKIFTIVMDFEETVLRMVKSSISEIFSTKSETTVLICEVESIDNSDAYEEALNLEKVLLAHSVLDSNEKPEEHTLH